MVIREEESFTNNMLVRHNGVSYDGDPHLSATLMVSPCVPRRSRVHRPACVLLGGSEGPLSLSTQEMSNVGWALSGTWVELSE